MMDQLLVDASPEPRRPPVRVQEFQVGRRRLVVEVERRRELRLDSMSSFRSAIFCSAVPMASAPAMNRRGGGDCRAMVMIARASLAGSPRLLAVHRFPIGDEWIARVRRSR